MQASKIDDAMVRYFGQAQAPPEMPGMRPVLSILNS